MFLPSSSIAFLFSPDFCLKTFDLTRRILLFFISASLASALASLISSSAMVCSCRFFFLDWHCSSSMHFLYLSLSVRSSKFFWLILVLQVRVISLSSMSAGCQQFFWYRVFNMTILLFDAIVCSANCNQWVLHYCMLLLRMSLFPENPLSTHDCPCEKNLCIF